jgi:hypothetical protein
MSFRERPISLISFKQKRLIFITPCSLVLLQKETVHTEIKRYVVFVMLSDVEHYYMPYGPVWFREQCAVASHDASSNLSNKRTISFLEVISAEYFCHQFFLGPVALSHLSLVHNKRFMQIARTQKHIIR